ncbi:MAG TPA: rhomboid family intramembrane serine protease [Thermoanaerobaculia bacterium]|nr:rhomboid family intramembrane serine protease [Thermoanaerobaculia bacterium]
MNYGIIVVNVVIFLFQLTLGSRLEVFIRHFGVVPATFVAWGDVHPFHPLRYLPLLTSMFMHGGLLHLFGNMLTLWIFGDNVEDRMGHVRYLIFYLFCGVCGSMAHIFSQTGSSLPSIGASGAIAGVMGAYVLLYPRARVLTILPIFFFIQFIEIPALIFMGFWFVIQFFSGVTSLGAEYYQQGGVAWWAHIGGFLSGILVTLMFYRRSPYRGRVIDWVDPEDR